MNSSAQDDVAALFLAHSDKKLEEMTGYLEACVRQLSDEQVWRRGGAHENAVGNLVLHLCGNMRQWILHGVDKQPDVRTRDAEFETGVNGGGMSASELMELFRGTVAECRTAMEKVSAERLVERTNPQPPRSGEVSVLDAIYQVVGHVQQHVGQIILLTKQMVGTDLDLTLPRKR